MKAVFDTNILVDYLQGNADAAEEIACYESRLISVITSIEVLVGARSAEEERMIRGFLAGFEVRELTTSIAEMTVKLRQQHRLKIPDAVIYATARIEGCLLVTRNTRDFSPDWPDLRVPYSV